jgi:hypothetical protein
MGNGMEDAQSHGRSSWMLFRRRAMGLALLVAAAAMPIAGQVAPSAEEGGLPLAAGGGFSRFNVDCAPFAYGSTCYMNGVTVWVDWHLTRLPGPGLLRGLGLELEGRDINYGLPASFSNAALGDKGTNLRQDTGLGGVVYTWRHFHKVHPYGKVLAGLGGLDFPPLPASPPTYRHDNRTITAFGGGADIRVWSRIWVRADGEYQLWPNLFGAANPLTPYGITLGAVYDFNGVRRR